MFEMLEGVGNASLLEQELGGRTAWGSCALPPVGPAELAEEMGGLVLYMYGRGIVLGWCVLLVSSLAMD
jgi:hypothetical protein